MTAPVEAVEPFDAFRRLVLGDPELQSRLRSIADWPAFVDATVGEAAEHGIALTRADVLAARDASRRSWLAQWL